MNEKERVYQELDECREKLAHLRAEVRRLNHAIRERTPVEMNVERARLRKALSDIAYNPGTPHDAALYRRIATEALEPPHPMLLKGKTSHAKAFREDRRRDYEAARVRSASGR